MDYVDRQEFEEFKRESEVYGDGNTIRIDKTAAGQYVTCTLPIDPGDTPNSIFYSEYNPSEDEYKIGWKDFLIQFKKLGSNFLSGDTIHVKTSYETKKISAGSFTFDYSFVSTSSSNIQLLICEIDGEPVVYWSNGETTPASGDATTELKRLYNYSVTSAAPMIQQFNIPAVPANKTPLEMVFANERYIYTVDSKWNYDPSTGKFYTILNYPATYDVDENFQTVKSWTVGASFSGNVGIGYTAATPSITNATSTSGYDDYAFVASVSTDSSKNLTNVSYFANTSLAPFGVSFSRTFDDNSGTTHTVKMLRGRIYQWSTS